MQSAIEELVSGTSKSQRDVLLEAAGYSEIGTEELRSLYEKRCGGSDGWKEFIAKLRNSIAVQVNKPTANHPYNSIQVCAPYKADLIKAIVEFKPHKGSK